MKYILFQSSDLIQIEYIIEPMLLEGLKLINIFNPRVTFMIL